MENENTEGHSVRKNKMVTLSLPPEELEQLMDISKRAGISVSHIVRGYMRIGLKEEGSSNSSLLTIIRSGSLE